jgi:hypothetical protein
MATTTDKDQAEFRRVMDYVTERALTDGIEEDVMAALFDVLNGDLGDGARFRPA